jgi:hypothetical protein
MFNSFYCCEGREARIEIEFIVFSCRYTKEIKFILNFELCYLLTLNTFPSDGVPRDSFSNNVSQ